MARKSRNLNLPGGEGARMVFLSIPVLNRAVGPVRLRSPTLALLSLAVTLTGGCASHREKSVAGQAAAPEPLILPQIDEALGERRYPNEAAIAKELSANIESVIRQQYRAGPALRDAHPKAHGCVQAEFQVLDDLPATLAKGMFVPGRTYQAWMRFSNGASDASRADAKRDARGVAIKVLGVPGTKLLEDESSATTQDFILINHPVFFATDPSRYLSFIQDANSSNFARKLLIPFDLGAKGTLIALQTRGSRITNPLQVRYWSMVPYQLGLGVDRVAVKYSVRACSPQVDPMPKRPAHNFLREALRRTLDSEDACMEFLLQQRTSAAMDVEDSRIEWTESQAPFRKVATIRIPRQTFDTADQNAMCENLSFTPWHSLPDHKPLGITNRLRKGIYARISRVRHEMNGTQREERR